MYCRYLVVSKPNKKPDALNALLSYIVDYHAGETGIVYCLSRDVRNVPLDALVPLFGV